MDTRVCTKQEHTFTMKPTLNEFLCYTFRLLTKDHFPHCYLVKSIWVLLLLVSSKYKQQKHRPITLLCAPLAGWLCGCLLYIQMLRTYKAELVQWLQRPWLTRPANNLPSTCHLQRIWTGLYQSTAMLCCHWSRMALLSCLYAFELKTKRKDTPECCQLSQSSYWEAGPALWCRMIQKKTPLLFQGAQPCVHKEAETPVHSCLNGKQREGPERLQGEWKISKENQIQMG